MSNSDDGSPREGDTERSDATAENAEDKSTGMSVPKPSASEPLGSGLDLDDLDLDSIFGSSGEPGKPSEKKTSSGPPPKVPRLPTPVSKPREKGVPPSRPKNDPPPRRRQAKTVMGLGVVRTDEDDDEGADQMSLGKQGLEEDSFSSEKTQMARGLGADSDADDSPETLGGLEILDIDEVDGISVAEPLDDLGDFEVEKTEVAESPLIFPEDASGSPDSPDEVDPLDDDRTEVGMTIDFDQMPPLDSAKLPEPDSGPRGEQASSGGPGPEPPGVEPVGQAAPDSFDEGKPSEPTSPAPEGFGFSNLEGAAQQAATGSQLPSPIGAPVEQPHRGEPGKSPGEFEDEKTELLDSPFTSEPLTARIHALEGPCAGQEFFVNSLRNTIGRATNNTITVADVAMSRQHLEIVSHGDSTFLIRDLNSINGTALNGTRIREGDLFHGDRFEAGKSVFQFVLSGDSIPAPSSRHVVPAALQTGPGLGQQPPPAAGGPSAAPQSQSGGLVTKIAIVAALFSILLIGGLGFLVYQKKQKSGVESQSAQPDVTPNSLYLDGVEAVKARDWSRAETFFKQARSLDPNLSGVDAQLERIGRERGYQKLVDDARELLDSGKRAAAVERVAEIPRESVYFEDGQLLLRENKKLTIEELYTQAMAAFGQDDLDLASAKIDEIREVVPDHEGAARLEKRIEEAEERLEKEVAVETTTSRKRRSTPKPAPKKEDDWGFGIEPSGGGSSGGTTKVVNFTRGYSLYRSKKFGSAVDFFDKVADEADGTWATRAERTSDEIKKFRSAYEAGNKAFGAKQWRTAEKQLLSARRFDKAVATNGYFGEELSGKVATAKANLGLAKANAKDYDAAYRYAKDANNYDAANKDLRKLRSELDRVATSLYVQAVDKRKTDPNEAAKLCRTIMSMTDAGNSNHKKAKKLLKEL